MRPSWIGCGASTNFTNSSRRLPVSHRVLQEKLECSRATVNRIIQEMRDFLDAPIVYDREVNGYRYDNHGEHPYELPGLWFNASELYALLTVQKLLAAAQPGFLDALLSPLKNRIERILENEHLGAGELARRVRILRMAGRSTGGEYFQSVAGALLQCRRIEILYHGRERDAVTDRVISPQRLVHYRGNWYLDAWCHQAEGLRSFALERIRIARPADTASAARLGAGGGAWRASRKRAPSGANVSARPLDQPALEIPDEDLDTHFARSYGIFAGKPVATAVLRSTPERARWVAEEEWHPQQDGRFPEDGGYELKLPYADPRELLMDILKYGPDVEVIAPQELRAKVADRLDKAARRYRGTR